jgi:predicted Zn-dependent protease
VEVPSRRGGAVSRLPDPPEGVSWAGMSPSRPGISRPVRALLAPVLVPVLAASLLSACATPPPPEPEEPRVNVSRAEEIAVGERAFGPAVQAQGGAWSVDPAVAAYVDEVGWAVARESERPDLPYAFVVLDTPEPTAWALPSGKIGISRALLAELSSEAELAALLAHEVAHAGVRRGTRRLEQQILLNLGNAGVLTGVGEQQEELVVGPARVGVTLIRRRYDAPEELDADRQAMEAMSRAGYDPAAAVTLLEDLLGRRNAREPGWQAGLLGAHPPTPERIAAARRTAAALPRGGTVGTKRHEAMVAPIRAARPAYELAAEAELDLGMGDMEAGLAKAREAAEMEPREAEFVSLEAQALLLDKRWDEAVAAADRAVALDPDDFRPWQMRGLARKGAGDAAGARRDLARSIDLLPLATSLLNLAELELDADETEPAREHLRLAAGTGSPAAIEAAGMLTRMEIGEIPGRYVSVGVGVQRDGYLYLIVENRSPLRIRDVTVSVTLPDTGEGPVTTEFTYPGPFEPLRRTRRVTDYGPVPRDAGVGARAEVTAAALVEEPEDEAPEDGDGETGGAAVPDPGAADVPGL